MAWTLATLDVESDGCPAAQEVTKGRLTCNALGGHHGAVGHLEGKLPPGWRSVTPCGTGRIVRGPDGACSKCPVAVLPEGVHPLGAAAGEGRIRIDVACEERQDLSTLVGDLRSGGMHPVIVRARSPHRIVERPVLVDLATLTVRQREALTAAMDLGYFATGQADVQALADRLGCCRSTAHEHLRKGLDRLLRAAFSK